MYRCCMLGWFVASATTCSAVSFFDIENGKKRGDGPSGPVRPASEFGDYFPVAIDSYHDGGHTDVADVEFYGSPGGRPL